MPTTVIQYNPQNAIVSSCLDFLSTLKGVKILSETESSKIVTRPKVGLSAQKEKELFFAGSKKSMAKHFEKYL
jgi:hypothetical protein